MLVTGKHNTYEVIHWCENENGSQKWFQVKCVDFFEVDDLGDLNLCKHVGQEIWVANYHFRNMPVLEI